MHSAAKSSSASEPLAADFSRELGRVFGSDSLAGECVPPIDVYETDDTLEIAVDLRIERRPAAGPSGRRVGEDAPRAPGTSHRQAPRTRSA